MHRKNTRRWHKLLSVSGILFAAIGTVIVPTANAQPGGPSPDAIYGPSYSTQDYQVQWIDFWDYVDGLQTSDLYLTGTATGCFIDDIPPTHDYSFAVRISGCSDGYYRLNLRAESVSFANGLTGPTSDYIGRSTQINRTPLTVALQDVPTEITTASYEWHIAINHDFAPQDFYDITATGCAISSITKTSYGLAVLVEGCTDGTQASLTLNQNFLTDYWSNTGPDTTLTTGLVNVTFPSVIATPEPTPTASASQSPSQTPSPTPSSSRTRRSVAITPLVESPTPTATPEPQPSQTTEVVIPPIAKPPITKPPVSKPAVKQETEQQPAAITTQETETVYVTQAPEPQQPMPIEQEQLAEENFDWKPIGYLAIGVGGVLLATAAAITLRRTREKRALRFS